MLLILMLSILLITLATNAVKKGKNLYLILIFSRLVPVSEPLTPSGLVCVADYRHYYVAICAFTF